MKIIADDERNQWMIDKFGGVTRSLTFEHLLYDIMENSCKDFSGGWFDMIEESNGACWLRCYDKDKTFHIVGEYNQYEGDMTGEAFSIASCILAINRLAWYLYDKGDHAMSKKFSDLTTKLKKIAFKHEQWHEIAGFID